MDYPRMLALARTLDTQVARAFERALVALGVRAAPRIARDAGRYGGMAECFRNERSPMDSHPRGGLR